MKTEFLIRLLVAGIILVSGCVGPGEGEVKVLEGVEFQIRGAEYEAGKILVTLSTNVSVENVRIDIVDEADQLLCTRYRDLIAGITQIELTDCKVKERITVAVSQPAGGIVTREFQFELPSVGIKDARFEAGNIVVTVDADDARDNVRIDIIDETNQILCTKYKDLVKGVTEVELTDCEVRDRITVSVSPPKTEMITRDFTLTLPEVRIRNVESKLGKLILSLEANMDMNDVRMYVFGKEGEVLCTKSEDLTKGSSERELTGCLVQKEITVSVSPPTGKTTARDFMLELPLLELKEGMSYGYIARGTSTEFDLDVYVTKETDSEWQGIFGSRETQHGNKKSQLFRFKIYKKELDLLTSYSLDKDEVLEDVTYTSAKEVGSGGTEVMFFPFILSVIRESSPFNIDKFIESGSVKLVGSGPTGQMSLSEPLMHGNWLAYEVTLKPESGTQQEVKFFISAAKPYLLINLTVPGEGPILLEKVEEKAFDLSDYEGYEIEVKEIQERDSFCEPDGVAGAVIKNIGGKPIYTADIVVVQLEPSGAGVSAMWDKEVIQPGETATFRDQCEGTGERSCTYQLTSPRGTAIHIGMHCVQ